MMLHSKRECNHQKGPKRCSLLTSARKECSLLTSAKSFFSFPFLFFLKKMYCVNKLTEFCDFSKSVNKRKVLGCC